MGTRSAPDPSAPVTTGQRWRLAGAGAGSLIVGRGVTALCGFIQVKIVLSHLGPAGLGIWIALTGLLWSAGVLDGGLGFAVQNRLTKLLASGERAASAALVSCALRWLSCIGGGVVIIGLPLALLGRWDAWLGIAYSATRGEVRESLILVVLAAALSVPLSLSTRVAAARQAMWITGLWTTVASVAGLGAVVFVARLGPSLPAFVAAACILPLAPHVLTWFHVHPTIARRSNGSDRDAATGLWKDSVLFLVPQLGAAFISTLAPTLVTVFAGPLAAATFGVLQRLYGFALQIQTMGLAPTWPAYTHAAATHDAAFARRTFKATWVLTTIVFIIPTLLITPWVPQIVRLWLGAEAPIIPGVLLWAIAGWYVVQYCGQPIAMLLNGLGRMESLAATGWIGIAISLGLCAELGPRFGATGIVIALATSYVLLNLPVTGWKAAQALARMRTSGDSTP